jgi:WD40 repeat protein
LVSASRDQTLRLWKFEGMKSLALPSRIFIGHKGSVNTVDFSPQGNLIASGADDGTIRLWAVP